MMRSVLTYCRAHPIWLSIMCVLLLTGGLLMLTAQESTQGLPGMPDDKKRRVTMDSRVVELYGGPEGIAPVISPTKVDAFRIKLPVSPRGERPQPLGGYPIIAGPFKVDHKLATELGGLLSDSKTYDWGSAKGCKLRPGVAVRFNGKRSTTEIIFCFECDELVIYHDQKRVNGKGFELVRGRLVSLMKQIFPNDDMIQNLTEVNPRP